MNVIFVVSVLSYPKDEGRRKSESVTEYVAECVANFTDVTSGGWPVYQSLSTCPCRYS